MTAYYNENDPFAAQWLRNLIAAGHIAVGDVDDRSIKDVRPEDLKGYTQCHFFAGIGGWSYALRLAGWPDDKPVWTGSCPCQPFSTAGKQKGVNDERHLWPDWFRIIKECRPAIVFGEQVDAAVRWGWLDLVSTDLEGQGYAVGAAVLPAAGVEAPHARHRLFFVAHPLRQSSEWGTGSILGTETQIGSSRQLDGNIVNRFTNGGKASKLGNSDHTRSQGRVQRWNSTDECAPWAPSMVEWIPCTDGKWRPVEPGTFPLAHGIPARVGRLRAYGNAIIPQVAAEFIKICSSS